ncbi:superkiller complex protein 3 [Misgurnus anguillicaudatus]|uniref:superkiller complex protein 3 n=1 Tax=Misgurnus anguillicaudatus TaxID=75329 RepID=UPI002434D73D|nr:SKI3 subunit of superkiller complex protein [Misgurnus anguillicaudatus]XP_055057021.1 SKI3 subunit of superkiller complex protein [Misgurnus anguillicaudatus]
MSRKEVKTELKRARDAIKNKEFKEVLKHCKDVLKLDKNNYNAWVFIGVAASELQQPDQALAAYRKATELEPEQLLAWQGLANLYDKSNQADSKAELLKVYQTLCTLYEMSDKTKWLEVSKKLVEIYQSENNYLQVARVFQKLIQVKEGEEGVQNLELLELWMEMTRVLQSTVEDQDNETQQHLILAFERALELTVEVPSEAHRSLSENYIKFLSKLPHEVVKLKVICEGTLFLYPTYFYPLEVLCEHYMKTGDCSEEAFHCFSRLSELDPGNSVAHFGLGVKALLEKKYEDAIRSISLGLKQRCCSVIGLCNLSQAQLKMHRYSDSITSSSQGLKLSVGKCDDWTRNLQRLKLEALVRTGREQDAEEALQILAQISNVSKDPVLLALQGRALLQKDYREEAFQVSLELLSSHPGFVEGLTLKGLIHVAQNEHNQAEESFLEALSRSPENGEIYFLLGHLYWNMREETQRDRKRSYTHLLKAAKLDPYLCSVFRFLGHYYRDVAKDQGRAIGCYRRAFELDSTDEESGAAAVDLSMEQGDMEGALTVLQSVTETAAPGSNKWAWLRRGLFHLKIGQHQQAIADLQAALKADPQDWLCWECLGDAYLNRRSFTAALKTFAKAYVLQPTSIYSLYKTASIKQILGQFKDATVAYKQILKQEDYVPALKGLGECLLALAKSALEDCLDGRAIYLIQSSIHYLFRAVQQRPDLSCLWKLLGDACTSSKTVSPNQARVLVPGALCGMHPLDQSFKLDHRQLLTLGERCFGRALKLIPKAPSLWCDLGLNYYYQFRLLSSLPGEDPQSLLEKALQCVKKAVMLDSSNHTYWNTLGVVALTKGIENFALAQHSFIKSVTAEPNNVVAWSNLGALYLKKGNIEFSHEAFKIAQSLEPLYVNCWIGQAIIAETVGSYDTMDLFRHTTELSTHTEGVKAYAYWVCSTLLDKSNRDSGLYLYNIVQMNAVLAAQVALSKYTERIQVDPDAFIMLGYLNTHLQLKKQATESYHRAVKLLQALPYTEKLSFALRCYGCALSNDGQYEEAMHIYSSTPMEVLHDVIGLALACFRTGRLPESILAYEKALAVASTEKGKAYIFSALALIQHRLDSLVNAKTLLFKCSMLKVPVPESLQSLCALGLVHGDLTLASATLAELLKMGEPIGGAVEECCLLTCTLLALQGKYNEVHREAARAIHRNPGNSSLWALLSRLVPQYCPNKAEGGAVAGCVACHASFSLGKRALLYSGVNHLASGCHSIKDRRQNALKTIQKAVLLCPEDPAGWAGLMAACHTENTVSLLRGATPQREGLERALMTLVSEKVKGLQEEDGLLAQALEGWVLQQAVTGFKQSGQYDQAEALCSQVLSVSPEHPVVFLMLRQVQCEHLLLSVTGNNVPPAVMNQLSAAVMANHTSVFAWHWLAEVYRSQGLLTQASMVYRQSLQLASQLGDYNGKISSLLRLALMALIPCMAGVCVSEWQDLVLEACTEVLKIGSSPVNLLFQALLQFFVKLGGRETRRLLERIVYNSPSGTSETVLSVARWYLLRHLHTKDDLEQIDTLLMVGLEAEDTRLLDFHRRLHPFS